MAAAILLFHLPEIRPKEIRPIGNRFDRGRISRQRERERKKNGALFVFLVRLPKRRLFVLCAAVGVSKERLDTSALGVAEVNSLSLWWQTEPRKRLGVFSFFFFPPI